MKQQTAEKIQNTSVNPLMDLAKTPSGLRRTEYKVGNLFYEYISNTSLANSGTYISGAHVAEILEAGGFIKTFQRFGQTYYRWVKDRPSRSDFFRNILRSSAQ